MAIIFPQGFDVVSQEPIDTRLIMTREEMESQTKGSMPENYICICKDDGKLYIWNSSFDKDPITGRFRPYEEVMDMAQALDKALQKQPTQLADLIGRILPNALKEALKTQPLQNSGLVVDEDGNIKVNLSDRYFSIEDNEINLDIESIQDI